MSAYTDISIDPVIRMKAEKILENQKDRINLNQLEVINEERELPNRLNRHNLDNLSQRSLERDGPGAPKSTISKNQSVKDIISISKFNQKKDIFENRSRFE
jgi:hypothetical protein